MNTPPDTISKMTPSREIHRPPYDNDTQSMATKPTTNAFQKMTPRNSKQDVNTTKLKAEERALARIANSSGVMGGPGVTIVQLVTDAVVHPGNYH